MILRPHTFKKAIIFDDTGNKATVNVSDCMYEAAIGEPVEVKFRGYLVREEQGEWDPMNQNPKSIDPLDKRTYPINYRKVIFNPPATIVLWNDGTKTVVKCDEEDTYDRRTGLAMCFMKKALGNTSRAINDILHKELME